MSRQAGTATPAAAAQANPPSTAGFAAPGAQDGEAAKLRSIPAQLSQRKHGPRFKSKGAPPRLTLQVIADMQNENRRANAAHEKRFKQIKTLLEAHMMQVQASASPTRCDARGSSAAAAAVSSTPGARNVTRIHAAASIAQKRKRSSSSSSSSSSASSSGSSSSSSSSASSDAAPTLRDADLSDDDAPLSSLVRRPLPATKSLMPAQSEEHWEVDSIILEDRSPGGRMWYLIKGVGQTFDAVPKDDDSKQWYLREELISTAPEVMKDWDRKQLELQAMQRPAAAASNSGTSR